MRLGRATALALTILLVLAGAAASAARQQFDTRVLALIPTPGFPARAYVSPDRRVYEGTYSNPSGDTVASRVLEYSAAGALLRSWTIAGQDLAAEHGVQVATSDARGRLVLLDKAPARVLLLNRRTGRQRTYATFPAAATPNYAAWGPGGVLYVTDYTHATIWRVPAGGGSATAWFADPRLNGLEFGTTGVVMRPGRRLLIAQQSSAGLGGGNPATGKIYELAVGRDGAAGAMRTVWESAPLDAPDGFAVDRAGRIYIALLLANQIAVIAPNGTELARYPSAPGGGENGSPVPFDNSSSAVFLGRRLMIANQSFLAGDRAHQAILDVWVGARGAPEWIPKRAGKRPRG